MYISFGWGTVNMQMLSSSISPLDTNWRHHKILWLQVLRWILKVWDGTLWKLSCSMSRNYLSCELLILTWMRGHSPWWSSYPWLTGSSDSLQDVQLEPWVGKLLSTFTFTCWTNWAPTYNARLWKQWFIFVSLFEGTTIMHSRLHPCMALKVTRRTLNCTWKVTSNQYNSISTNVTRMN